MTIHHQTLAALAGGLLLAAAGATERPPPRGAPAPGIVDGTDGGTDGERFIASLPPSARAALLKDGQAIVDQQTTSGGPSLIRAVARFERPRAEVFELISRPSDQARYLPNLKESKTFGERTAEGERTDFVVVFLFVFKYRTQHWFYPDSWRVEWNLDKSGGDGLDDQEGFWQLYELDADTTVGEYGTRIVAKGAILNFFRSLGERGAIIDALKAFRRHIDSAATR